MTQHPSLRSKEKGKQHRSVLKRYERVRELKEKEKWKEGDSVFGLLKLKILKFKIKKEKVAPAVEAVPGAEGAGPPTAAEGTGGAEETRDASKETAAKKEPPKKEGKK